MRCVKDLWTGAEGKPSNLMTTESIIKTGIIRVADFSPAAKRDARPTFMPLSLEYYLPLSSLIYLEQNSNGRVVLECAALKIYGLALKENPQI
jgi:hypothetical protein